MSSRVAVTVGLVLLALAAVLFAAWLLTDLGHHAAELKGGD